MTRPLARIAAALGATLLAVTLTGCGGGDAHKPLPPVTTPATTTSAPTSTPTTPTWAKKYTKKQLAEYRQALSTWNAYERAVEPIWAKGQATPRAKRTFKRYLAIWPRYWNQLQSYDRSGVQIRGLPNVLNVRATRVKGRSVTIRQCVDGRSSRVLQHGTPAPGGLKTPYVIRIDLGRSSTAGRWLIYSIDDTSMNQRSIKCTA